MKHNIKASGDRSYVTVYPVSEILQLLCTPKATFSIPLTYSRQNFGVCPLE